MERSFSTFFAPAQLPAYQQGVLEYRYRGLGCRKSPIDIALYLALLGEARPRTIIEIGTKDGGSALLLRDLASLGDERCGVVSIDLEPPDLELDGIRFLQGDVHSLGSVFEANDLDTLPRPWFVVEDSAHTARACRAALEHFAARLGPGEWLAMEDGVLDELGLSDRYDGGPNRAIAEFFDRHPGVFSIGERYCDMFGPNATYNPNGYLQRSAAPFDPDRR